MASEAANEVARTDFSRFRRGRLYDGVAAGNTEVGLQKALTGAFDRSDMVAVLDITSKVLAEDQADIRAHLLRGIALRKLQRIAEADFHRGVAVGMIKSIMETGDGHSARSAWTVFLVKEEYEIMKVIGCVVESQALLSDGGRRFDVLEGRRVSDGATIHAYFDITELSVQEEKAFGLH